MLIMKIRGADWGGHWKSRASPCMQSETRGEGVCDVSMSANKEIRQNQEYEVLKDPIKMLENAEHSFAYPQII